MPPAAHLRKDSLHEKAFSHEFSPLLLIAMAEAGN
jgi:hypothetical protein